jgi:hypothetical protein
MPDFTEILNTLREQKEQLESELQKVNTAITALQGVSARTRRRGPGRPKGTAANKATGGRKKRKFSAATIAKMRAAQRARWAKVKRAEAKR